MIDLILLIIVACLLPVAALYTGMADKDDDDGNAGIRIVFGLGLIIFIVYAGYNVAKQIQPTPVQAEGKK